MGDEAAVRAEGRAPSVSRSRRQTHPLCTCQAWRSLNRLGCRAKTTITTTAPHTTGAVEEGEDGQALMRATTRPYHSLC